MTYCWISKRRHQHFPLLFHPWEAVGNNEVAPQLPALQIRQARVLTCSSHGMPSSLFTTSLALLWMHSTTSASIFNSGAQIFPQHLKWGCSHAECSRIITCFDQLLTLHLRMWLALLPARVHCWLILSLLSVDTHFFQWLPCHSSLNLYFCPELLYIRCRIQCLYL